ncbi:MAG: Circadian clock protein kinase KaiC [Syntrophorhabdaceae bacterium PtaU1.Bin034]|nr:MAG: Circadian clock protein kinase KaiC [Syntrophorhabdaceae bacterium PtaU1.Bin034]
MSAQDKVIIRRLSTGVPGLDEILGGGLPEFSFNIIAGGPGTGKTTLAHQIVFANATPEAPALYFTVLGEPPLKMMRYQQMYTFFDQSKINNSIRFMNLSQIVKEKDLQAVLEEIAREVEMVSPGIVVVDSFQTVVRRPQLGTSEMELQAFVQDLALHLSSWQATTFLLGEYNDRELLGNPVFTVADGILWLYQDEERNSVVRKLQVRKLRGQAAVPGMHIFRITSSGLLTFSRFLGLSDEKQQPHSTKRLSMGVPELDAMMGGGVPEGNSILVSGSTGTGKSVLAIQFLAEGIRRGEPGAALVFEEYPQGYTQRAKDFNFDLQSAQTNGSFSVIQLRAMDLCPDEILYEVLKVVRKTGAKRVVIDSLSGMELALAPEFRADFRESIYRIIRAMTVAGATVLSTVEADESAIGFPLSSYSVSFLADDIIRLGYIELQGQLSKILLIVKMRGSSHSKDIREYEITSSGLVIGQHRLEGYRGLITAVPEPMDGANQKRGQELGQETEG